MALASSTDEWVSYKPEVVNASSAWLLDACESDAPNPEACPLAAGMGYARVRRWNLNEVDVSALMKGFLVAASDTFVAVCMDEVGEVGGTESGWDYLYIWPAKGGRHAGDTPQIIDFLTVVGGSDPGCDAGVSIVSTDEGKHYLLAASNSQLRVFEYVALGGRWNLLDKAPSGCSSGTSVAMNSNLDIVVGCGGDGTARTMRVVGTQLKSGGVTLTFTGTGTPAAAKFGARVAVSRRVAAVAAPGTSEVFVYPLRPGGAESPPKAVLQGYSGGNATLQAADSLAGSGKFDASAVAVGGRLNVVIWTQATDKQWKSDLVVETSPLSFSLVGANGTFPHASSYAGGGPSSAPFAYATGRGSSGVSYIDGEVSVGTFAVDWTGGIALGKGRGKDGSPFVPVETAPQSSPYLRSVTLSPSANALYSIRYDPGEWSSDGWGFNTGYNSSWGADLWINFNDGTDTDFSYYGDIPTDFWNARRYLEAYDLTCFDKEDRLDAGTWLSDEAWADRLKGVTGGLKADGVGYFRPAANAFLGCDVDWKYQTGPARDARDDTALIAGGAGAASVALIGLVVGIFVLTRKTAPVGPDVDSLLKAACQEVTDAKKRGAKARDAASDALRDATLRLREAEVRHEAVANQVSAAGAADDEVRAELAKSAASLAEAHKEAEQCKACLQRASDALEALDSDLDALEAIKNARASAEPSKSPKDGEGEADNLKALEQVAEEVEALRASGMVKADAVAREVALSDGARAKALGHAGACITEADAALESLLGKRRAMRQADLDGCVEAQSRAAAAEERARADVSRIKVLAEGCVGMVRDAGEALAAAKEALATLQARASDADAAAQAAAVVQDAEEKLAKAHEASAAVAAEGEIAEAKAKEAEAKLVVFDEARHVAEEALREMRPVALDRSDLVAPGLEEPREEVEGFARESGEARERAEAAAKLVDEHCGAVFDAGALLSELVGDAAERAAAERAAAEEALAVARDAAERARKAAEAASAASSEAVKVGEQAAAEVAAAEAAVAEARAASESVDPLTLAEKPEQKEALEMALARAEAAMKSCWAKRDECMKAVDDAADAAARAQSSAQEALSQVDEAAGLLEDVIAGRVGDAKKVVAFLQKAKSKCLSAAELSEKAEAEAAEALERARRASAVAEELVVDCHKTRQEVQEGKDEVVKIAKALKKSGELRVFKTDVENLRKAAIAELSKVTALAEDAAKIKAKAEEDKARASEAGAKAREAASGFDAEAMQECKLEILEAEACADEAEEHAGLAAEADGRCAVPVTRVTASVEEAQRAVDEFESLLEALKKLEADGEEGAEGEEAEAEDPKEAASKVVLRGRELEGLVKDVGKSMAADMGEAKAEAKTTEEERVLAEEACARAVAARAEVDDIMKNLAMRPPDFFAKIVAKVGTAKGLTQLFEEHDKSGRGKLTSTEVKGLLLAVHDNVDDWMVRHFMIFVDASGGNRVQLEDLRTACKGLQTLKQPVRALVKKTKEQCCMDAGDLMTKLALVLQAKGASTDAIKQETVSAIMKDLSGNGDVMARAELEKLMRKLLPDMNNEERLWVMSECWAQVDKDRNGKISSEELTNELKRRASIRRQLL